MVKITLKQIKDSLPSEKNISDSLWTRYILRPVSVPVSWVCLRLGLSANAVSYLSALFCIIGGILFGSGVFLWSVIGALLFNLFAILDCVDGNMARVTNTSGPYGAWADALGGYIAYTVVLISLGVASGPLEVSFFSFSIGSEILVLFGGLGAAANLLMRVIYQNYKNIAPEGSGNARKSINLEKMLSENLGITGILMPLTLISLFFGYLGYITLFYSAFYTIGCLITILKLIWKVEHIA